MTSFQYKRAPITEAVVEFRSNSFPDKTRQDKAYKILKQYYADHKEISGRSIQLEVTPDGEPITNTTNLVKNQFSSEDMTRLLTIEQPSFLVSQLAPYQGWENFRRELLVIGICGTSMWVFRRLCV